MLALLLDENLSDEIARQIKARRPDILIASIHDWELGRLRGASDEDILRVAADSGWTLVTYDVATIPLLLAHLAQEAFVHGGVVFVSNATIRSNDIGRLVRVLITLYEAEKEADWTDRLFFLPAPD